MNIKKFVNFTGFYRSLAIAKEGDIHQYGDVQVTVVVLYDDGRMVLRFQYGNRNVGYLTWSPCLAEAEFFSNLFGCSFPFRS